MPELPLDPDTADRLLAGAVNADDAPPGYAAVAALFAAAACTAEPDPARQASTVSAMAAAVSPSPTPTSRRSSMLSKLLVPKVAAAALSGVLSLSGVAAAATGTLGDGPQTSVADAASHLGLDLPRPNVHPADDAVTEPADNENENETAEGTKDNHGACVSLAAHDHGPGGFATRAGGGEPNHGAAVSAAAHNCPKGHEGTTPTTTGATTTTVAGGTAANRGPSHHSNHGNAGESHGNSGTEHGTPTTRVGGTGTADDHSGGHSEVGTERADDASHGRSSAGSDNSGSGHSGGGSGHGG